jgi:CheY-like chemotaxis protein
LIKEQKMAATVLVVDDEAAIREMLGFALRQEGYNYQAAADAEQAWRQINESLPDIVLLDWMLPGMSGIELQARVRNVSTSIVKPLRTRHRPKWMWKPTWMPAATTELTMPNPATPE